MTRALTISPDVLFDFLRRGACRVEVPPIPENAVLSGWQSVPEGFKLLVSSADFTNDESLGHAGIENIREPFPAETLIKIERDGVWRSPATKEEAQFAIEELAYRIAEIRADDKHETFEEFAEEVEKLITSVVDGVA